MKVPALVMASLLAVSVSGQTTKPVKKVKKPVGKVIKKTEPPKPVKTAQTKFVPIKDTIFKSSVGCPACGMG
ncbi:MNIO class RiPP chryseobasin precursor ChrA [Chryseobacterium sp. MIQD13]|uniref:MNIO class RiPP chryseobasin precursor ChrA n=1 Tax=Chryseobacterium sp. MIQD13 TaxID=3422310 RepID=UPI003D2DF590